MFLLQKSQNFLVDIKIILFFPLFLIFASLQ